MTTNNAAVAATACIGLSFGLRAARYVEVGDTLDVLGRVVEIHVDRLGRRHFVTERDNGTRGVSVSRPEQIVKLSFAAAT